MGTVRRLEGEELVFFMQSGHYRQAWEQIQEDETNENWQEYDFVVAEREKWYVTTEWFGRNGRMYHDPVYRSTARHTVASIVDVLCQTLAYGVIKTADQCPSDTYPGNALSQLRWAVNKP
jgi:hypothetical protein